jgi:hypothetical protein
MEVNEMNYQYNKEARYFHPMIIDPWGMSMGDALVKFCPSGFSKMVRKYGQRSYSN